jgi:hypothetical protein
MEPMNVRSENLFPLAPILFFATGFGLAGSAPVQRRHLMKKLILSLVALSVLTAPLMTVAMSSAKAEEVVIIKKKRHHHHHHHYYRHYNDHDRW